MSHALICPLLAGLLFLLSSACTQPSHSIMLNADSIIHSAAWRPLSPLPNTEGYAGGYAGVTGGSLYFAGGTNFAGQSPWNGGIKTWSARIYRLNAAGEEWQLAGELPKPRAYGASLSVNNQWILIGGGDAREHDAEVWRAVADDNGGLVWSRLPDMPKATAYCSAVIHDQTLFVAAGTDDPGLSRADRRFWSLDLQQPDRGWQELEPWPGPARILAVMTVVEEEIFILSGKGVDASLEPDQVYLTDGYAYHTVNKSWRKLTPMPFPAAAIPSPAPVIDGRKIVILGGNDGSIGNILPIEARPDFPATLYIYDVVDDAWTPGEDLPFGQKVTPTTPWQGMLIIPSGELRPGVRTPTVWAVSMPSK